MKLSSEQQAPIDYLLKAPAGTVVLIGGPAGSGKSTIYGELVKQFPNSALAAPTGCAAVLIGGTTVHKLFGLSGQIYRGESYIQTRNRLFKEHWNDKKRVFQIMAMMYPKKVMEFLASVGCIIIDEFPMLRCDVWDEMDARLRFAKKEPHLAFGGVKMVLSGDLAQLPAVVTERDKKELDAMGYLPPYDFSASRVFKES